MAKRPRKETTSRSRSARSDIGSERRPRRNRKRLNKWPAFFRVVGLLALTIWLCFDPRFRIRDVRVEGLHTIAAGEILTLAHAEKRHNIFIYSILECRSIDRRIEAGEPAVEAAHVRIKLPHTLILRIQERTPYAQVKINGGSLFLADATGVPYRQIAVRDPIAPVIIVPASVPAPELGKKLDLRINNPIGVAFYVMNQLTHGSYFVPLKLREIDVRGDLYSLVTTSDRPVIRLGMPDNIPLKLATAAAAIDSDMNEAQHADYVDVTLPSKPAIKMKVPAPKPI